MRNHTFSIGDTSKLTGVSKKQIRNWEAKGYIPEAERVVSHWRGPWTNTTGVSSNASSRRLRINRGYKRSAQPLRPFVSQVFGQMKGYASAK
jgi:hypothetical protein